MAMKISGEQMANNIQNLQNNFKANEANKEEKNRIDEKVEFSSELKQVNQSKQKSIISDPKRIEKIESLKKQVKSGNYDPDLKKVAASLLKFLSKIK